MEKVRCEYCRWEQDIDKSRICDRCGRRLSRTREFGGDRPVNETEGIEAHRCPNCGISTSKAVCKDCGAPVRPRTA